MRWSFLEAWSTYLDRQHRTCDLTSCALSACARLLAVADATLRPMLITALHTGLRRGEMLALTWHDLRHTFASYLVMAGVNLTSVKALLGHKTLAMTLRYVHLAPDFQRDAISRLDTYLDTTPAAHAREA